MTSFRANWDAFRRSLSWLDIVSFAVAVIGTTLTLADVAGGVANFLKFISLLAGGYLVVRLIGVWRTRLLWSLRNRLIVAYLFIAVVPILLIVTLVVLAGQILYSQLGAYLLYDDIHQRIAMIADITEHIAAAHGTLPKGISEEEAERVLAAQSHLVHDQELLGLSIEFSNDPTLLDRVTGKTRKTFAGLVE